MINNETAYTLLTFLIGFLSGFGTSKHGDDIVTKFKPKMNEIELEDLSNQLRDSAHRLLQMADITDRLANGEDTEDIEANMTPDMQIAWNKYKEEHL